MRRKRFGSWHSEGKQNYVIAARMMVLIVTTYLVGNAPSVLVTTWEFVAPSNLHSIANGTFYGFFTEVVSILTVLVGTLRLPIYLYCNWKIRREFRGFSRCFKGWGWNSPSASGSAMNGILITRVAQPNKRDRPGLAVSFCVNEELLNAGRRHVQMYI